MEIHKILDKNIHQANESYLIHWKGQHQTKAEWVKKSEIIRRHPSVLIALEQYDRSIDLLCERIKRQNNFSGISVRLKKNRLQHKEERKRIRKLGRRINKDENQLFEKAKQLQKQYNKNVCIPASEFTIPINTPLKTQCHWLFGDRINSIEGKQPNKPLYTVVWADFTKTVVTQQELIERQCEKLCNFLEARLLRRAPKKPHRKQSQVKNISEDEKDEINQQ